MVVWCTQNAPRRQQFHVAPALPALQVQHFGGDLKTCYKKLVTHVESHASAVSQLESGEKRNIKASINNNNCCFVARKKGLIPNFAPVLYCHVGLAILLTIMCLGLVLEC